MYCLPYLTVKTELHKIRESCYVYYLAHNRQLIYVYRIIEEYSDIDLFNKHLYK